MTKKIIDKIPDKIYILLIIAAIGWFLYFTRIKDVNYTTFVIGTFASILAAAICHFLLRNVDNQNSTRFETKLDTALSFRDTELSLRDNGIIRIGRNSEMGEQFWIDLINDLDTSPNRAYFIGTKLYYWLKSSTYKVPLKKKLEGRLKIIAKQKEKNINTELYSLCILLTDSTFLKDWQKFFNSIKNSISSELGNKDKAKFDKTFENKIKIESLSKDFSKYSLVFCGNRLAVTPYISTGNALDCLTLDIKPDSKIGQLYQEDISFLKQKLDL